MHISPKSEEAKQRLVRIRERLRKIDELMASHSLELDGEEIAAPAIQALILILGALDKLNESDRARVFHSLIDYEGVRTDAGYQFIANFVNDRYLLEQGPESAAEYWRYLADVRNDKRFSASCVSNAENWAVVLP